MPATLQRIKDSGYRTWAKALNSIWRELCRRVSSDVKAHPELNSLLYLPNPFIVPGGRFREFYYWSVLSFDLVIATFCIVKVG